MTTSVVRVSMEEDNGLFCSFAVVEKERSGVVILLRDLVCAVFPCQAFCERGADCRYLLLKHYEHQETAYKDFLKLIGKMCKKREDSKYFLRPKEEDNRMVFWDFFHEKPITDLQKGDYDKQLAEFWQFIRENFEKIREQVVPEQPR